MKKKRIISLTFFIFTYLLLVCSCGQKAKSKATEPPAVFMPTRSAATLEIVEKVAACDNVMNYIDDVNYTDGAIVEAGSTFLKEWEVQNIGSCTWGDGYVLRFISGEQMTDQDSVSVPAVPAGSKGKLSIQFTAPQEPGSYRSEWKLFGADNRFFGNTLFVDITVQ